MGENTGMDFGEGKIYFSGTTAFGELVGDNSISELSVRRAEVEQTNSSVILGERLILKAYRRLQKGVNPDLEIGRHLTERGTLREHAAARRGDRVHRPRRRDDHSGPPAGLRGEPG